MKYRIFVHDPSFFLYSQTPHNMPGISFKIDLSAGEATLVFSTTQREDLNRKSSPCIEDPDYDFQQCVRNYLAREIGCKLPWDNSQDFNECSTVEALLDYSATYHLLSVSGLLMITNHTGCVKPCHYKEHKIVSLEQDNTNNSLAELNQANTAEESFKHFLYIVATEEIVVEKEVPGYTALSLLADMGGSLGMFLGFSFIGAWNTAESLIFRMIKQDC